VSEQQISDSFVCHKKGLEPIMTNHSPTYAAPWAKGFSIVELMVVIGLVAVMAAVAVPAFTVWVSDNRLKVAAGDVFSALQLARSTALRENADVVIWFNTSNDTYRAYVDDGAGGGTSGDGTQNGTEVTVKDGTIQDGIDMYNTVFSVLSNQTSFNSRGMADGGWGYVYLKNDTNKYKRITVWATGHIKMETSTDGSTWS
jgi:prepilin-type N-terminal cleavage/methylation domain-containing protein